MPRKRKSYPWTVLPRETLRELVRIVDDLYTTERRAWVARSFPDGSEDYDAWPLKHLSLSISGADGTTVVQPTEAEDFFGRLGDPFYAYYMSYGGYNGAPFATPSVSIDFRDNLVIATVEHPDSRAVDRVMGVIRDAAAANAIPIPEPEPEKPRVFIGHGGSGEWQKTERWLRTLDIEVKAYETLPHSGRTIERVLTDALQWANFALLVMTAEDERADATMQARQNVVHELGLFQGRLGWDQALVLLEDGTTEFSNIAGTNQFRFPAGAIDAKHGDIIVALRERFGNAV